MWRRILPMIIAVTAFSSASCVDVRVRAGARPDESLLEQQLVMRKSTMEDVKTLLGAPFGIGASLLPIQDRPRTMWSYYYEEGTLIDDRRMFLFVYFTEDNLYEGYLWFSSLPRQMKLTTAAPGAAVVP